MSDYTKATNFATKDALLAGNALKIVSGTELNTEFNAIQVAVNTKANLNSPTLTGVPTSATATGGTNTTQLATTAFVTNGISSYVDAAITAVKAALYPVGSIYINATVSTNPATLLGLGTWVAYGAGRVMVGLDSGNINFDALGETGGSADAVNVSHTHTATVTDPGHVHGGTYNPGGGGSTDDFNGDEVYNMSRNTSSAVTDITVANSTEGVSGTDKNLQPYITVYMWKRTA